MKRKRTGKAGSSGRRAQKDLTDRKGSITGGDSDLGNQLQIRLQEANNIYYTPAPPPPPPPPPPARIIRPR